MRYRLQRKEPYFPIVTYRWKDIAASDDLSALEKIKPDGKDYRIEDTYGCVIL